MNIIEVRSDKVYNKIMNAKLEKKVWPKILQHGYMEKRV